SPAVVQSPKEELPEARTPKQSVKRRFGVHPVEDRKRVFFLGVPNQTLDPVVETEGYQPGKERYRRPSVNGVDDYQGTGPGQASQGVHGCFWVGNMFSYHSQRYQIERFIAKAVLDAALYPLMDKWVLVQRIITIHSHNLFALAGKVACKGAIVGEK